MDEIRDIHNTEAQYINETKALKKDTNKVNFRDWQFYEEWMISQGRLKKTILKHIYNFRSFLKLYPTKNLKNISQKQIIEATYNIMISKYADRTKKDIQIFLKQYLHLFANTTKRHYMIDHFIKIIPTSEIKVPDHLISHSDFEKIINYLEKSEHKLMVKILYSTGMRITELFNIKHTQETIQFTPHGVWIHTRGKRTQGENPKGIYKYFMIFFVEDFKKYIKTISCGDYLFTISYTYFRVLLKNAVEKNNLNFRIYPHLFRHTQATALFRQFSDQQVYKVMNWSPNSKMAKVYSNLNDQDIINTMSDFKKNQNNDV